MAPTVQYGWQTSHPMHFSGSICIFILLLSKKPKGTFFNPSRMRSLKIIQLRYHLAGVPVNQIILFAAPLFREQKSLLLHPLQKHLRPSRIENPALATLAHNPGGLFRGQPPQLHVFDHLADWVERDPTIAD